MNFSAKSKTKGQNGERARDWRFNPSLWTFKGHPTIKRRITTCSLATLFALQAISVPMLPAFAQQKPKSESIINYTEPAPENSSNSVSETFKNKEVQTSLRGNEGMNMAMQKVEKLQTKQPETITPMKLKAFEEFVENWRKEHKKGLEIYTEIKSNSKSYYFSEQNAKLAGTGKIDFVYTLCTGMLSNIKAVESTNSDIKQNPLYTECIELTDNQIAKLQTRHSERVAAGVYNVESTLVRDQAILSNLILRFGVASLVAAGSKDPSKLDRAREMLEAVKKGESVNLYTYLSDFVLGSYYIHASGSEKTLEGAYHKCMTTLLTPAQIKAINWAACSYSDSTKGCIANKPDSQDLSPDGTQFTAAAMREVYAVKYTSVELAKLKQKLSEYGIMKLPPGAELPYNSRIQARDYNPKFFEWDSQKKKWARTIIGDTYAIVQDLSDDRTGVNIIDYGTGPEALPVIFQLNRYTQRNVYPVASMETSYAKSTDILANVPRTFDVIEYSMKSSKDRTEREMAKHTKAIADKDIDSLLLPANIKSELKSRKVEIQPFSKSQYYEVYSQVFGHLLLNHALSIGERILQLRDPNFLFPEIIHDLSVSDKKTRGKGAEVGMTSPAIEEIVNLGTIYIPVIVGSHELIGEVKVGVAEDEKALVLNYDKDKVTGRLIGAYNDQGKLIAEGKLSWNQRPIVNEKGMKMVGNALQDSTTRTYVPDEPAQVVDARLTLDGKPISNNIILSTAAVKEVEQREVKKMEQKEVKKISDILNEKNEKVKGSGLTKDEISLILKGEVPQDAVGKMSKVFDSVSMNILFKNVQTKITQEGTYLLAFTWEDKTKERKTNNASIEILPTAAGYLDTELMPIDKDGNRSNYNAGKGEFTMVVKVTAHSLQSGGLEKDENLPVDEKGNPAFYLRWQLMKEAKTFPQSVIDEIYDRKGVITEKVYNTVADQEYLNPQQLKELRAAMGVTPKEMKLLFKAKGPDGESLYTKDEKEEIKAKLTLTSDQVDRAERFTNMSKMFPGSIERLRNLDANRLDDDHVGYLEDTYKRFFSPENVTKLVPHKDENGEVVPGLYDIRMTLRAIEDTRAYRLQVRAIDRAYENKDTAIKRTNAKGTIFETREISTTEDLATPTDPLFLLDPGTDKSTVQARSMTVFYFNSSLTPQEQDSYGLTQGNMDNVNTKNAELRNYVTYNGKVWQGYEEELQGFLSTYGTGLAEKTQAVRDANKTLLDGTKQSAIDALLADPYYAGDTNLLTLQKYLDPNTPASQRPSVDEAMDALIHSPLASKLGGRLETITSPEIECKTVKSPTIFTIRIPWPTQFYFTDMRIEQIGKEKNVTWDEFLYMMRGGNQALSEKIHLPGVREGKMLPKIPLFSSGKGKEDLNRIYEENKLSDAEITALDSIGFFKAMEGATEAKERKLLDAGDYLRYKQLMASPENKAKVPESMQNALNRFDKKVEVTDNIANELKRNEFFKRGIYKTFKAIIIGKIDAVTTFTVDGQKMESLKWDSQRWGAEFDVKYGDLSIMFGKGLDGIYYKPKNVRPLIPNDIGENLAIGNDIWGNVKAKRSLGKEIAYNMEMAGLHVLRTVSTESDISVSNVSGGKVGASISIPLFSAWEYLGKGWPGHFTLSEEYTNFLGQYANGQFQGTNFFDKTTGSFTPVAMAFLNTKYGKFGVKFAGSLDYPTLILSDPIGWFDIGYRQIGEARSLSVNINQEFWNDIAKLLKLQKDPGHHLHKKTDNK